MRLCILVCLTFIAQQLFAAEIKSETVAGGAGLPLQVISAGDPVFWN